MISKCQPPNHGCTVTQLLVSVRDRFEAALAVRAKVDLIDVKEPNQGSLGRSSEQVWNEVARELQNQVPLSVACGELMQVAAVQNLAIMAAATFAKVGLAGANDCSEWPSRWAAWRRQLPEKTQPVAVVYADYQRSHSPPPLEILEVGASLEAAAMLVDTHLKGQGNVFDVMPVKELEQLIQEARDRELITVVGGSVGLEELEALVDLNVDFVAVRGAVCHHDRTSTIDESRLLSFVQRVRELSPVAGSC